MPVQRSTGAKHRPRSPKKGKVGKKPHRPRKTPTAREIEKRRQALKKRKQVAKVGQKAKTARTPASHAMGHNTKARKAIRKTHKSMNKRVRRSGYAMGRSKRV